MIINDYTAFVYDIEIFINLFTCTIKNSESKNICCLEISDRKNDIARIPSIFLNKKIIFVGFNCIHYDNPIISYIILNYEDLIRKTPQEITSELKTFSDLVIHSETSKPWSKYKYANLFKTLDLLTMMFATKLRCSLKELQVTMQYHNVQEYEGDFNSYVKVDDIDNVLLYNINDVNSSEELMYRLKPDIDLRIGVNKEFNIDVLSTDGVNLGVEIIKTKYLEETHKTWKEIKDLRSPCHELYLKDIIFDFISFKTNTCKKLLNTVKSTYINLDTEFNKPQADRWKVRCLFNDVEITYSLGGIHTKNKPEIWKSDKDWILIDSDCASMYPSAIINYNLYPKHCGPEFLTTYKKIRADRIEAKRTGNKILNTTYKLALNGISGMLQSEYSWCYDPKTCLTLRLNCQLMLLMLTEMLVLAGCKICQLNTDGALYLAPRAQLDEIMKICKQWEQITKFELEHEYFDAFYQYAVNDYIGVYQGYYESRDPALIKTKGLFLTEVSLGKGMAPIIISEALQKYFIDNIPVEDTIRSCTDIKKFITYQKVHKSFIVKYGDKIVSHINRYYMSTNGYSLNKCEVEDGTITKMISMCSSGVTILNKFDDKDIKERRINYQYYINEAYKIIYPLTTTQLSLF